MLDINNAIRKELRIVGGRTRHYYVFDCTHHGCCLTFRATPSDFHKRSGFCKRHAKSNSKALLSSKVPFLGHYKNLRRNAAKHHPDKEFDITYEQFFFLTQIGVCHYCGESNIVWNARSFNRKSNLDRKDNTIGYVFNNVVVCCKECNFMKRDWLSYEEFKAVRRFLKNWRESDSERREEMMYDLVSHNMKVW